MDGVGRGEGGGLCQFETSAESHYAVQAPTPNGILCLACWLALGWPQSPERRSVAAGLPLFYSTIALWCWFKRLVTRHVAVALGHRLYSRVVGFTARVREVVNSRRVLSLEVSTAKYEFENYKT